MTKRIYANICPKCKRYRLMIVDSRVYCPSTTCPYICDYKSDIHKDERTDPFGTEKGK